MTFAYHYMKDISVVGQKSTDRIIELKTREGTKGDGRLGIDPRLFNGENKLHAIQDSGLWRLKYERGALPGFLQQKFTNFNVLMKYLTEYFNRRNVDVKEVKS